MTPVGDGLDPDERGETGILAAICLVLVILLIVTKDCGKPPAKTTQADALHLPKPQEVK